MQCTEYQVTGLCCGDGCCYCVQVTHLTYEDYVRVIEQVKAWVKDNMGDFEALSKLVSA